MKPHLKFKSPLSKDELDHKIGTQLGSFIKVDGWKLAKIKKQRTGEYLISDLSGRYGDWGRIDIRETEEGSELLFWRSFQIRPWFVLLLVLFIVIEDARRGFSDPFWAIPALAFAALSLTWLVTTYQRKSRIRRVKSVLEKVSEAKLIQEDPDNIVRRIIARKEE